MACFAVIRIEMLKILKHNIKIESSTKAVFKISLIGGKSWIHT